jgi:putative aldouronate transport system substrate-binding protein
MKALTRIALVIALALIPCLPAVSSGSEEPAGDQEISFNPTGLPIVDETVTFDFWAASSAEDPNQFPLLQQAEEKTNVHINWTTIPSDAVKERLNLMWASGDYPDALTAGAADSTNVDPAVVQNYGSQGIILTLNDLIEEHMPNLQNFGGEYLPNITYPDGNIYYFPYILPYFYANTSGTLVINREWLDTLGMDAPTTTGELLDVLRAFKTMDPNGNGDADEIPFSATPWGYTAMFNVLFGAFGVPLGFQIADGELVNPYLTEKTKAAVQFVRQMYEEGLIDPEIFTQDNNAYLAKGRAETMLYGVSAVWREGYTFGDANSAAYEILPPVEGPYGDRTWLAAASNTLIQQKMIVTSACEHANVLARWVDYFMDPAMGIQVGSGPLGYVLELNNGVYRKVVPEGYGTLSEWLVDNHFQQMPYIIDDATDAMVDKSDSIPNLQKMAHDEVYMPYMTNAMPTVLPTEEEADELALIKPDLEKYLEETISRWISGQGDVDSEWADYVRQAKNLGFDRYVEIHQGMYERYLAF